MKKPSAIEDTNRLKQRQCWRQRGSMFLYGAVLFVLFAALVSLATDLARVQMVKTELRRAADAAARAGMAGLSTSVAQARTSAASMAAINVADGTSVAIDTTADIEFGTWDRNARTFTVLSGSAQSTANSIRITARRTSARGNPVPLLFARCIGISSCNVTASTIAAYAPRSFGVIGLNYINMSGNATDSYWATSGSSTGANGSIASNGNITLGGSSSVEGDARPGVGHTVSGSANVSGSTAPLATPLIYPNGSAGSYATVNDDSQIPGSVMNGNSLSMTGNKSVTLPGGNYLFNNFSVGSNCSLAFSGPATIYCYGTFTLSGGATTAANLPTNLNLIMVPNPTTGAAPGSLNIGSHSALYANIYAPQSPITLSGTGDIYGSVLGLSIDMTGTSAIHYDMSLSANGSIAIVQ